jgi:hypothetical protein
MIVLKPKHSLHGKSLLPIIMRLKDVDVDSLDEGELARLKKDHPLENYTLEELEQEFTALSGEQPGDIFLLAGKVRTKETAMALINLAIYYANEIGGPKSTPLSTISRPPSTGPSTSTGVVIVSDDRGISQAGMILIHKNIYIYIYIIYIYICMN